MQTHMPIKYMPLYWHVSTTDRCVPGLKIIVNGYDFCIDHAVTKHKFYAIYQYLKPYGIKLHTDVSDV